MHSHHVVVTHSIKTDHNKDSGVLGITGCNHYIRMTWSFTSKECKPSSYYLRRTFEGAQVQRNSTEVCEWLQHVAPCWAAAAFNTQNNPVTHWRPTKFRHLLSLLTNPSVSSTVMATILSMVLKPLLTDHPQVNNINVLSIDGGNTWVIPQKWFREIHALSTKHVTLWEVLKLWFTWAK